MTPLDSPHLRDEDIDATTMSFGDHLDELRSRVIKSMIMPAFLLVPAWFISNDLLRLICAPLTSALQRQGLDDRLQVLSPPEALMTQIKITLIAALIASAPWIFWQFWQFIRPGLYRRERRFVYFLVPGSVILTLAGLATLYFVMLPLVLVVLVNFGTRLDSSITLDHLTSEVVEVDPETIPRLPILIHPPSKLEPGMIWMTPRNELLVVVPAQPGFDPAAPALDEDGNPIPPLLDIRRIPLTRTTALVQTFQLTSYVNFVLLLTVAMVLAFQTPLVILLLGWVDLVSVETLTRNRRIAAMVLAVISTLITPADPWSMLAMLIPLYLLFELGILLLRYFPAKRVAEGVLGGGTTGVERSRSNHEDSRSPGNSDNPPSHSDQPAQPEESTDRTGLRPFDDEDSDDKNDQERGSV